MELIPYNSISPEGAGEVGRSLNALLANYQIYQKNLLKLLWNRQLKGFLDLHQKMNRVYQLSHFNIHQIANKIMALGEEPMVQAQPGLLPSIVKIQALQEVQGFEDTVYHVIHMTNQLLEEVREVFMVAADYEEKQTMIMMQHLAHQLHMTIAVFTGVRASLSQK
jgi:DNA-binding ferritin-like protein